MVLEKRFRAVSPQLLQSDGGSRGQITVTDTCLFKVKQKVILNSSSQDTLELEVKRIESNTLMLVGPRSTNIKEYSDVSAYLTADSAFIFANEQHRPSIPYEEYSRAAYEEEPVVAWRNMLVDKYGIPVSDDNPLPTDAIVTIPSDLNIDVAHPTAPTIVNHTVIAADTEFFLTLPNGTKRFKIKVRDGKANLKMAFGAGEIAANRYIKVRKGFWQEEGDLDLPDNSRIYLEADKDSVTIELLSWQL